MSLIYEYLNKKWSVDQYLDEIFKLVREYNAMTNSQLVVYASAYTKNIPDTSLTMDDFFVISDLLRDVKSDSIDFYIESPGGSGEAAEEIAEFLHKQFTSVKFVISGEAKSAATILALSGDEIAMTKLGSLGPIDAQLRIGRGFQSAYDYLEWVRDKRNEAAVNKMLNPFDAVIISQISPGELNGVVHAFNFAKDLIIKWLPKYKFKDWNETEISRKPVTDRMKVDRATEIANQLADHSKWRSHGRSIKIDDLSDLLKIINIDDKPKLAEKVYRIQTLIKLIFNSSNHYKIFVDAKKKIFKSAVDNQNLVKNPPIDWRKIDEMVVDVPCEKCGKEYKFCAFFKLDKQKETEYLKKGIKNIKAQSNFVCDCGQLTDLTGIRNHLLTMSKRTLF